MYDNFNKDDRVYMIMVRENGNIYDKIIEGIVTYSSASSLDITSTRNLQPITVRNGKMYGKDLSDNKHFVYETKSEAELVLKEMLNEQSLRQEVQNMIKTVSIKQLEAIYSYITAEKERNF